MEDYQKYRFVDKTGKCLDAFAAKEDDTDWHILVANMLNDKTFEVGDMLSFRDDLIIDGFKWGIDFYFKKCN